MTRTIRIPVHALRRGDVLTPTNREVMAVSRGVFTPAGKLDVDLRRAEPEGNDDNPIRRHSFHSGTIVTVVRS